MTKYFRTRALDDDGDIVTSGEVWIYGVYAVAQTIRTRLMLYMGENWRDASDGTPWIQKILGKNNNKNNILSKQAILKKRILETDYVLSIPSWSYDFDYSTRTMSITATIVTEFGTISIAPTTEDLLSDALNNVLGAVQYWTLSGINYTVTINV